jgi:uncharacterized protein (DUF302 family)
LDYSYRREGTKGYLDTVGAVERCIRARGFTLEHVHDLQATLASKGFAIDPLRIYEFDGRRPLAAGSIDEDADARLDLLMPCRVNVFVENEKVVVAAVRPTVICSVFPEAELDDAARAIEEMVVELVDEAVA